MHWILIATVFLEHIYILKIVMREIYLLISDDYKFKDLIGF